MRRGCPRPARCRRGVRPPDRSRRPATLRCSCHGRGRRPAHRPARHRPSCRQPACRRWSGPTADPVTAPRDRPPDSTTSSADRHSAVNARTRPDMPLPTSRQATTGLINCRGTASPVIHLSDDFGECYRDHRACGELSEGRYVQAAHVAGGEMFTGAAPSERSFSPADLVAQRRCGAWRQGAAGLDADGRCAERLSSASASRAASGRRGRPVLPWRE